MMVPNGWYPWYANPDSQAMVREYVTQYGGTASGVNADVAEAYSVGQVAPGGHRHRRHRQRQIITYLHSAVTLNTVQGPVKFDALGHNGASARPSSSSGRTGSFSSRPPAYCRLSRSSPSSRLGPADPSPDRARLVR